MAFGLVTGIGLGYGFTRALRDEQELKQGANEYFASMYQTQSLSAVSCVAGQVFERIPGAPPAVNLLKWANFVLPLVGTVGLPAATVIKKGQYEAGHRFATGLLPALDQMLPTQLSDLSQQAWTFVSENARFGVQLGMGAAVAVLPLVGMTPFAAGLLVPMIYGKVEQDGFVPPEIGAVIEKIGPTLNTASLLMTTGLLGQAMAASTLVCNIPAVNQKLHQKLERKARDQVPWLPGMSLEQYDREWVTDIRLSRQDIMDIVDNKATDFNFNPAHFGKETHVFSKNQPVSCEYSYFLALADQIDWTKQAATLRAKFRVDERLLEAIDFNSARAQDFDLQVEQKLGNVGNVGNPGNPDGPGGKKTCADLLRHRFRSQLQSFVEVLLGLRPHAGSASDLLTAKQNCSYIVPYVRQLGPYNVETVDILLALGIEGGEYCALGLRLVTGNVKDACCRRCNNENKENDESKNDDGSDDYSYKSAVFQGLQSLREAIAMSSYKKLVETLAHVAKLDAAGQKAMLDVHTAQFWKKLLMLGFGVLSPVERAEFTLQQLYHWMLLAVLRESMGQEYRKRMHDVLAELKHFRLFEWVRNKLRQLEHEHVLTSEDLNHVDEILGDPGNPYAAECAGDLFFCFTGILFPVNDLQADYCDIVPPKEDVEDENGWGVLVDY